MESTTRFVYGPEAATAAVATAYAITVSHAWLEVAVGALYWSVCGVALITILSGGAWWIVHNDAKRYAVENAIDEGVIIAGRIGNQSQHAARRAA